MFPHKFLKFVQSTQVNEVTPPPTLPTYKHSLLATRSSRSRALRSPRSLALFQGAQGTQVKQVTPNTLHTNNDLFYPGPPSNPGPSPPSHPHRHTLISPRATRIFSLTPHMPKTNCRQSGDMDHSNAKNMSAKATILSTKRPAFFEENWLAPKGNIAVL